jgi:hypothetical protein
MLQNTDAAAGSGNRKGMIGFLTRPGAQPGAFSVTTLQNFYEPEKYMWMFQAYFVGYTDQSNIPKVQMIEFETRTARKMQKNDTLVLYVRSMDGDNLDNVQCHGVVQFWCKE